MKVYKEVNYHDDFEFWSGAKSTCDTLTEDEIHTILSLLEDCCPDGMSETELNDFFWFDTDTIAEWLGWDDYETLYEARSSGKWFDSQDEYNEYLEDIDFENRLNDAIHEFRRLIDSTFSEWFLGQTDDSYIKELVTKSNHEPGNGDGVYDVLDELIWKAHMWDLDGGADQGTWDAFQESDEYDTLCDAISEIESIWEERS